jgi:hypothetical protein
MPKIFRLGGLSAIPAVALLAACSETQAPMDDDALFNYDVAQYVAETNSDDIVLMTTEAQFAMSPGLANHQNCERRPLSRIRCQPRRFSGDGNLNIARDVTYYTFDGDVLVVMDEYDALNTEAINYVVTLEGSREATRDGRQLSMTVSRASDYTVSGLFGEETQRIWNGSGSAEVNRTRTSDDQGTRTYDMSSTKTVDNVIIAVPRAGTWPLSGTITREVTVEVVDGLEDPRTRTRTVVITFDGTQFATIDINGEVFTLDLENREVIRG